MSANQLVRIIYAPELFIQLCCHSPHSPHRQASNTPRQLNNELNQTLHEVDEDYELEIGNYNPVQPLFNDHGISLISLSSTSYNKIDHHLLQVNTPSCLPIATLTLMNVFLLFHPRSRRYYIMAQRQCFGSPTRRPVHRTSTFDWSAAAPLSRGNDRHGVASSPRWTSTCQSIPRRTSCRGP